MGQAASATLSGVEAAAPERSLTVMAKPFDRFPTQGAAKANARRILREWDDGSPLTGQDALDVTALLRNHPDAEQKIGSGVDYHYVGPDDWGTKGFRTRRTDGTEVVWSYPTALSGRARDPRGQLLLTMRNEVAEDVAAFKRDWFTQHGDGERAICSESYELVDWSDAAVHHDGAWTFNRIANSFIFRERLEPESVAIVRAGVGSTRLGDRPLAARWRQYHLDTALLAVVGRAAHAELERCATAARAERRRRDTAAIADFDTP
jgi:hypothetical protein